MRRLDELGRDAGGARPGDIAFVRMVGRMMLERRGRWDPELEIEGVGRAAFVLVANGDPYSYAGSMPLHVAPDARFEDGLDFAAPARVRARDVPRSVRGRGHAAAAARRRTCSSGHDLDRIEVHCDRPLPLQADGEDLGDVDGGGVRGEARCGLGSRVGSFARGWPTVALELRRVLDGDAPPAGLSESDLLELHRRMVLLRTYDERSVVYHRQGRIGTYAIFWNHEAIQAGATFALGDDDWIFPSYRESAIGLVRGMPAETILQWWRGHPSGWWSPADWNVASICVPIATHVPHAAGLAWGKKLRGEDAVAMAFFGDGATSEGAFHEGVNLAAVMNAPAVFVCNNNSWAISTPVEAQTRARVARRQGGRLRHPRRARRRARRARRVRGGARRGRARARRRRADADRGRALPRRAARDRRRSERVHRPRARRGGARARVRRASTKRS